MVTGEVLGTVVFGKVGFKWDAVGVLEGKDIDRIDEGGVWLKPMVTVVLSGLASATLATGTLPELLNAVLPIAAKKEAVKQVEFSLRLKAVLDGDVDGPGVGSAALGGGRAFVSKQVIPSLQASGSPVLGELRGSTSNYSVTPALRVSTSSGIITVPVDTIVSVK